MTKAVPNHLQGSLEHMVLSKLGNPKWDLLIVGDGSGSGWNQACGWAATLVDNVYGARRFFYGGMDCGSVNLAESMPYLHALSWYDAHHGKTLLKQLGFLRVHVLTDSQTIATWGNRAASPEGELPRKQLAFWAGIRELRRIGYQCEFHWSPRITTELNWAADLMAGLSRLEIIQAKFPGQIAGEDAATRAANAIGNLVFYNPETGQPINPYQFNP
jgi:hypothetical protein